MKHRVTLYFLIASCAMLQACAGQPPARHHASMLTTTALPATEPGLDHYIAWVPLEQAQTAAVAEAMTHISLKHAREQLGRELCAGESVTGKRVVEKHGPVAARTPASMGAYPAWYYRISQQPGLDGCVSRSAPSLYQALQSRLPSWISVSPGNSAATHTAQLVSGL